MSDKIMEKPKNIRVVSRNAIVVLMATGYVAGFVILILRAQSFQDGVALFKDFTVFILPFIAYIFGERAALKIPGRERAPQADKSSL